MNFCIPPELSQKLKDAVRAGTFDIASLYEMDSQSRRDLFAKYTDPELGKFINKEFEKAIVSRQQDALKEWVQSTFSTVQKKSPAFGNILDKIEQLDSMGVLGKDSTPFLEDLVAQKMGMTLTGEEVQAIREKAQKLETTYAKVENLGDPSVDRQAQLEYFSALKDMNDYIAGLNPSHALEVGTSIIGRGNLLARISSPVINIISNTVWGGYQAVERRILSGSVGGANNAFARKYVANALETHQKTGFDVSRMQSLLDEQRVRGEQMTTSEGPGAVRKVARFYEDIVFKQMMGAPDVLGSAIAFSDSANIESTLIASRKEGLSGNAAKARALEIFKDAARVDPQTLEGVVVREKAIADAQQSTFTNESTLSRTALGVRDLLNKASGDLHLGDQLMPFVKTPANIVQAGIDVGGFVAIPDFFIRGLKTFHSMSKGNTFAEASREEFKGFAAKAVRAGLGMALAVILASMFDTDDFIGAYDPKEAALVGLKRGVNNAIKVGGHWVSLDYFGPVASAFVGIMYAKKYGNSLPEKAFNYYRGGASQVVNVPGFDTLGSLIQGATDFVSGKTKVEDLPMEAAQGAVNFVTQRMTPGIVSDFAKMTDEFERTTKGQGLWGQFESRIPFLRKNLPVATDALGDDINTQNPFSQLLFGSRVKEGQDNAVITELDRLSRTNNLPALTKIEDSSTRLPEFLKQKGQEKYDAMVNKFYDSYKTDLEKMIVSGKLVRTSAAGNSIVYDYKNKSDEEKKDLITKLKGDLLDDILEKAGYKPPKKKKS